MLTHTQGLF